MFIEDLCISSSFYNFRYSEARENVSYYARITYNEQNLWVYYIGVFFNKYKLFSAIPNSFWLVWVFLCKNLRKTVIYILYFYMIISKSY